MLFTFIFACQTELQTLPIVINGDDDAETDTLPSSEAPLLTLSINELLLNHSFNSLYSAEEPSKESLDFILIDARNPTDYSAGHIPGAINFHVDQTWNEAFTLLPIPQIESLLGNAGITHEKRLIVYDEGSYKSAARLFWVLESHGHEKTQVLNGGILAWNAHNPKLKISTTPHSLEAKEFVARIRSERIATKLNVRQAIDDSRTTIVDTRPKEEYAGEISPLDKRGRIPSAIHIPWGAALKDNGVYLTLKNQAQLKESFASIPKDSEDIIAYCNKGKQSAVLYLGLRQAGYAVSTYDGSWFEWSNDPSLPIE